MPLVELITSAGLEDGRFLVRTRSDKPGEYVLCVVYKGKATHHLIAKNGDGFYCVNKKAYGEYTKVNRVSAACAELRQHSFSSAIGHEARGSA
jgi:hypothetical protein